MNFLFVVRKSTSSDESKKRKSFVHFGEYISFQVSYLLCLDEKEETIEVIDNREGIDSPVEEDFKGVVLNEKRVESDDEVEIEEADDRKWKWKDSLKIKRNKCKKQEEKEAKDGVERKTF